MPLTNERVQQLKSIIVSELANLNTLSQVIDILVAGNVNVDKEGKVLITLSQQNRTDLETEIRDRNEQLRRITAIFDEMTT